MKLNYEAGKIPTKYELSVGEVAYNVPDGIQYTKLIDDSIIICGRAAAMDPDYGIESGGNALGSYTKFPDGTMICKGYAYLEGVTSLEIVYPVEFVGTVQVVASIYDAGDPIEEIGNINWGTNTSSIGFILRTNNINKEFNWIAIGRWKESNDLVATQHNGGE